MTITFKNLMLWSLVIFVFSGDALIHASAKRDIDLDKNYLQRSLKNLSGRRLLESFPYISEEAVSKGAANGFLGLKIARESDSKNHPFLFWKFNELLFKQYKWDGRKTLSARDDKRGITYYKQQRYESPQEKELCNVYFDSLYRVEYWQEEDQWFVEDPISLEQKNFSNRSKALGQIETWQDRDSFILDFFIPPWLRENKIKENKNKYKTYFLLYLILSGEVLGHINIETSIAQKKVFMESLIEGLDSLGRLLYHTSQLIPASIVGNFAFSAPLVDLFNNFVSVENPDFSLSPYYYLYKFLEENDPCVVFMSDLTIKLSEVSHKVPKIPHNMHFACIEEDVTYSYFKIKKWTVIGYKYIEFKRTGDADLKTRESSSDKAYVIMVPIRDIYDQILKNFDKFDKYFKALEGTKCLHFTKSDRQQSYTALCASRDDESGTFYLIE